MNEKNLRALFEKLAIEVTGWMDVDEMMFLCNLARNSIGDVVEVGAFAGQSAICFAAGVEDKEYRVYSVDHFRSIPGIDESINFERERRFRDNIEKFGYKDKVTPIVGESIDIANKWNMPIGLLYIDADHEYHSVVMDIRSWVSFVMPGGVIAFHDYFNKCCPGVKKACDKYVENNENMKYESFYEGENGIATMRKSK